jgi:hypothetical protein
MASTLMQKVYRNKTFVHTHFMVKRKNYVHTYTVIIAILDILTRRIAQTHCKDSRFETPALRLANKTKPNYDKLRLLCL